MPRPPGRDRVLSVEERDRILRWADSDLRYDAKTGTFGPGRIRKRERHRRLMIGRLVRLGLATGTRPGKYWGMAWAPHPEFGHIDVETGLLHRCPIGAPVSARKRAPSLKLSPDLLAMVRGWKEQDRGQRFAFRTMRGGPTTDYLADMFVAAMEELGIAGVTPHVLRHTCITRMIERGVSASVISAVVGISVEMLRRNYNHSDEQLVQPIAHGAMDEVLR